MKNVKSTYKDIVEKVSKAFEVFDFTPAEARIFTYLYLIKPRATQQEIEDSLKIARSAISTALKSLERLGFVSKLKIDGKNYYFIAYSPFELFRIFLEKYKKVLHAKVREIIEERIKEAKTGEAEILKERLTKHEKIFNWINEIEEKIDREMKNGQHLRS